MLHHRCHGSEIVSQPRVLALGCSPRRPLLYLSVPNLVPPPDRPPHPWKVAEGPPSVFVTPN